MVRSKMAISALLPPVVMAYMASKAKMIQITASPKRGKTRVTNNAGNAKPATSRPRLDL